MDPSPEKKGRPPQSDPKQSHAENDRADTREERKQNRKVTTWLS